MALRWLCIVTAAGMAAAQSNIARLFQCDVGASTQLWTRGPGSEIVQHVGGACLDVAFYETAPGSTVWTFSCHPGDTNPAHQNQAWAINANGTITEPMSGLCLDAASSYVFNQAPIVINECSGVRSQQWSFDNATGLIVNGVKGFCLDVGYTLAPNPCVVQPGQSMPFCDVNAPVAVRVASLVANLTLAEKLGLFANSADGVPRLNIPSYEWWNEGLHGVAYSAGVSFGGLFPAATSFPQVITTASSFNISLYRATGEAIGREARAMSNLGQAGLTYWTPNINIIRDPRWGRAQETPGEDTFHTSAYVANFVGALQGGNSEYLLVSACCKHYYAYDLEDWGGVDRNHFDAIVSAQDATETYLPAFQSCVQRGNASGIMCSYNSVNGVPSCANADILTATARQAWGFQGYITSDCGAVADVYYAHHYANTTDAACADVLNAGMDIDCGYFLDVFLGDAVANGAVTVDALDTALNHLFTVQFRLGMFDPPSTQPYLNISASEVNSPAHQQLALDAAHQGMVLLKNTNATLPLSTARVKTIALIGPNGNYNGPAPYLISPEAGLSKYVNVMYELGCDVGCTSTAGFQEALAAAASADAVVLVVGIDQSIESEGHDRTDIGLPGYQNLLIQEVAASAKGPVIVVVMGGGPLDISVPKSLPNVQGIIFCGYPGQSGGQAIADVIFGTYAPAGRLPYTMYPSNFTSQVSMFDMNMRPNATSGNPGHTYKFYTGYPVYAFGTGLTYSTFNVSLSGPASVSRAAVHDALAAADAVPFHAQAPLATVTANVTNTGNVASGYVVMLFVMGKNPVPLGPDPIQSLVGFDRVLLEPGQWTLVTFPLDATALSRVTEDGKRVSVPGTWQLRTDGAELNLAVV